MKREEMTMTKRITIGRDESNDWRIPENYETVSNRHANIEETADGHLCLVDHSTNGTVVNGKRIRNTYVDIREGDEIRLANAYILSWNEILRFFPRQKKTVSAYNGVNAYNGGYVGRETELHNTPRGFVQESYPAEFEDKRVSHVEIERAKSKWNWAAFLLNWIWGVGHDCWWPLFAYMGLGLLSAIFVVAIPVLPFLTPVSISISNLATLAISIYLGVKGNSVAWKNGCFDNIEHFERKERRWLYAAIAVWCVYLLCIVFIVALCLFTAFSLTGLLYGGAFDFS